MSYIIKRCFVMGTGAILFLLLMSGRAAYAQNFARPETAEDEFDDMFLEANLDNLVMSQGVPLYSGTDFIPGTESKYTLGPEDIIRIEVLRHPEVSGEFLINSEGKIQYGFVGDIELAGMTKKEAADHIVSYLEKFIISPDITLTITGYNSKIVYVIGEVGHPGKIFMRGDTITVREALVQAALPLLTAKPAKSYLITPSVDGRPKRRKVNVHKLLYQGDLRENLVMKPGDVLYVPPTVLTKAFRAIQPVAQPIGTATGTGRAVTPY